MTEPDELSALLQEARSADPMDRIMFRDAIAATGAPAVEAMSAWISDPVLGAFAVRVLQRIGSGPDRTGAVRALERGRRETSDDRLRGDIDAALTQLGVRGAASPSGGSPFVHAVLPAAGVDWPGFQAHEFGQIAGTAWRSRGGRTSLAPIMTTGLRYQQPHFQSYAIDRSPEIHFAVRERYQQGDEHEQGWRAGKLVVYAHRSADALESYVTTGLYVEKGYEERFAGAPASLEQFGLVDDRWDWPWFIQALHDEHVRDELTRVMTVHDLTMGDYVASRFGHDLGRSAWRCTIEAGTPVMKGDDGTAFGRGWDAVVGHLLAAPKQSWVDLHLWRSWPADVAIAAGRSFAIDSLLPVLRSITDVYLDILAPVLPRISRR